MDEELHVGDEIEVTLRGKLVKKFAYDTCALIRAGEGFDSTNNYIYLDYYRTGEQSDGTVVKKISPNYYAGHPYKDASGRFFIRNYLNDAWVSDKAVVYADGSNSLMAPKLPMEKL